MLSSSAALALLTSTAAKQAAAYNMATRARIFFNMNHLLRVKNANTKTVAHNFDEASTITRSIDKALTRYAQNVGEYPEMQLIQAWLASH